jgi:hypothetical protein
MMVRGLIERRAGSFVLTAQGHAVLEVLMMKVAARSAVP